MNCKNCKADCASRGYDCEKDCQGHIPKNNADRIRSMTYEELSSWINDHADCNRRCEAWKDGCMDSDSTCRAAWLEWLKEEVKDGT